MLNSIYAAQAPQTFIFRNWEVATTVTYSPMRSCVAIKGSTSTPQLPLQYTWARLKRYARDMYETQWSSTATMTTRASPTGADPHRERVLDGVRRSTKHRPWLMVESYLGDGAQPVGGGVFGKSITDACIGWERTSGQGDGRRRL